MSTATAPGPKSSTGPDVVVGVDTHKHTHMAVALSGNGGLLGSLKIEASRSGYKELLRWAAGFGSSPMFAVEGTGCYGAGLCRTLQAGGLQVVEVNRPDTSHHGLVWRPKTRSPEAAFSHRAHDQVQVVQPRLSGLLHWPWHDHRQPLELSVEGWQLAAANLKLT